MPADYLHEALSREAARRAIASAAWDEVDISTKSTADRVASVAEGLAAADRRFDARKAEEVAA